MRKATTSKTCFSSCNCIIYTYNSVEYFTSTYISIYYIGKSFLKQYNNSILPVIIILFNSSQNMKKNKIFIWCFSFFFFPKTVVRFIKKYIKMKCISYALTMHVLISIPNFSLCIILSLQFYSILLRVPPYLCPLLARPSDHTPTRTFFIAQRIVQMLTKWSPWSKIQILLR